MAYAALLLLAQLIEQMLHQDQLFCIPQSEEQKLECLQEKVGFLQGFLDEFSYKGREAVQLLEAEIRDAARHAQDIIEFHISDRIRSDYQSCGVKRGFLQLISTTQKVDRRAIQNKYEENFLEALEHIDFVVKEVKSIQTHCRVEETQISHISALASSSSAPNGGNKMVGFDDDLLGIKARLCGESSKLEIIPIVGMGGIGKTTLARNIFDDSLIQYHFDIRAWITISQAYHFREILLCLLDFLPVTTKDSSKLEDEELMEDVYKSLKGRIYLIIMDDMWSTRVWDNLRRFFPDDNNGSRIVITTRLNDVAEYASCSPTHQMHFLNEDQGWSLLREKLVFAEQSCPPELENIGRIIAKNCGGLPLAIAVVAGILAKVHRTQYQWENIARNISLAMATTDHEHFSKILSLSYDHLPNHLKSCFLYMGGFPEDHEIPVSRLIMLWVAEGFPQRIGSKSLEEVAEEYLEDLVKRNLVLINKKSSNGKFKLCGIHDLLRDLCIQKAKEEKFLHVHTSYRDIEKQHHLTIRSHIYYYRSGIRDSPIRSVLHYGIDLDICLFVLRFTLLRVLDITKIKLDCFPVEMTELFHLRYLAFTYYSERYRPRKLPPSISKLHNLQTLIIYSRQYKLPPLPFQIWKFPQLRHLILTSSKFQIPSARRIGVRFPVLENLQTLSGVINFKLTSKAIDMIPNLKKLKVQYTRVPKAKSSKLCLNNLAHLHQLEKLSLKFKRRRGQHPASYALPPNLKKLTLRGCRPPSNDMAIIGSLPNLEVLKLKHFEFVDGEWESNEGEFPKLKFLLIKRSNLGLWRAESSHFPCLERLIIRRCKDLKEIPQTIGDITTLELIEVDKSSSYAADSAVSIREEQESLGNDSLQVRLVQW